MWVKMLFGLKEIRQYRMSALLDSKSAAQSELREEVVPEYQGKTIGTLLYKATYDAPKDQQVCM